MKYLSTRGHDHSQTHASGNPAFTDILLEGLAPDGGLYLPESYPQIDLATLQGWASLSYADLAYEVLSRFATDIEPSVLKAMCHKTYTAQVYQHARAGENAADITPVKVLGTEQGAPLALLGLSNGPTLAFKDMAMQFLGNAFEYALTKTGRTLNILGATSGDTGSAAEYAMRGKQGIKVFMLSPQGKMSAFQQAQMFSLQDENIFNIAMKGWFDDCQDVVKRVSEDLEFKRTYNIGAVNSINWGRIVAQVVYYFKGYLGTIAATGGKVGDAVDVCVPSGNFGNICAGHIARQMGLPLGKLIAATNENNVLDEFFRTGKYRVRKSSETLETTSPSMDISKASNFERFVFDLMGRDAAKTAALMEGVAKRGGFDLSGTPEFAAAATKYGFLSGASNHAHRMATVRDVAGRYGVVIDTHTADGVKVARENLRAGVPMLVLETALPAKFAETIEQALNAPAPRPAGFEGLEELPKRFDVMDANVAKMKAYIQARA
jgi:threonine synthase